jgi:hypothetical protein
MRLEIGTFGSILKGNIQDDQIVLVSRASREGQIMGPRQGWGGGGGVRGEVPYGGTAGAGRMVGGGCGYRLDCPTARGLGFERAWQ